MKKRSLLILSLVAFVFLTSTILVGCRKKECQHEWGPWTVVANPTCSAEGSKKQVCSKCQAEQLDSIAKVDHKFGDYKLEETSCLESIKKSASCIYGCDTKDTIEIESAPGHQYVIAGHSTLGCTTNESTTYVCKVCNDSYEEVETLAEGHKVYSWKFVSETLKAGTTCEYVQEYSGRCNSCNEEVLSHESIHKHEYTTEVTKEATCQEHGIICYDCIHCDAFEEEEYENLSAHQFDGGVLNGNIMTYSCVIGNCSHQKTTIYAKNEVETEVSVKELASNELELKNASIALDSETLGELLSSDVKISADKLVDSDRDVILNNLSETQKDQLGDNDIFNFGMEQDGLVVSEFGGKVKVTIEYQLAEGEDPNNIAIWYLQEDGTVEALPAVYSNGFVTFETTHFSYYSVTRLSAKERCEIYGHSYVELNVDPTCTSEGYTMKICRVCADTNKTNIVEAYGHDYEVKTTDPTCLEKGSVVHTCKTCNFNYASAIKPLGHNWVETDRVDATTSASGYIKYECSTCEKTSQKVLPQLDVEVKDLTDGQIIDKILKDIKNHRYTFKVDNLSFVLPFDNEAEVCGEVEKAELYLYLNEDKELNGYFIGSVKFSFQMFENNSSIEGFIVNNKIYVVFNKYNNGSLVDNYYSVIDLYKLPQQSTEPGTISSYLAGIGMLLAYQDTIVNWYNSSFYKVIEKVQDINAESIDEFKEKLTTGLFDLNKNSINYELSLKVNQLDEVLNYLTTHTVYDLVESILGGSVLEDLDIVLDFTVEKLINQLEKLGLELDDLIPALNDLVKEIFVDGEIETIDQLIGMYLDIEDFDLREFLDQDENKMISVSELIERYTEMSKEEVKEFVQSQLDTLKEIVIIDLVGFGSTAKPMSEDVDDQDQWDYLINLVELLDQRISFTIVANEEYIINNMSLNFNLENSEEFDEYQDLLDSIELISVPTVDVSLSIIPDLDSLYVNENLINKVDGLLNNVLTEETIRKAFECYISGYTYDVIEYENGTAKIVKKFVDSFEFENDGYKFDYDDEGNPIAIFKITEVEEFGLQNFKNAYLSLIENTCGDWYYFYFNFESTKYLETQYAYLEYDELTGEYKYDKNNILTVTENVMSDCDTYFRFSYNIKNGKADIDRHDHKLVEDESLAIEAIECLDYGRKGYLCAECGVVEFEHYVKNHNQYFVEESIVFEHGYDCENGVSGIVRCYNCDYELHFDNNQHFLIEQQHMITDLGGTCPGYLEVFLCPCGDYNYISFENVECDIVHAGSFSGGTHEKCAVTDPQCNFNYYVTVQRVQDAYHPCQVHINYTLYFGYTDIKNYKETAKLSVEVPIGDEWEHDWNEETVGQTNYMMKLKECKCGSYVKEEWFMNDFGETIKHIETEKLVEETTSLIIRTSSTINTADFGSSIVHYLMLPDKYEVYFYDKFGNVVDGYIEEYEYSFYDGCAIKIIYYDYDGTYDYEKITYECVDEYSYYEHAEKCTDENKSFNKCYHCGNVECVYRYVKGHNWYYDTSLNMYRCLECGLKNKNGQDGMIIFMDSTSENRPNDIIIDYYTYEECEFIVNVSIVLHNPLPDQNDQILVPTINLYNNEEERYINFNKLEVVYFASEMGLDSSEYDIRVTFVPLYIDSDLDYSITLE